MTIFGDGEQTRDYVYVGDVAAANLRALETRAPGPFNVGTGVETSVNALYRSLQQCDRPRPAAFLRSRTTG